MSIGERIKERRMQLGLSQRELADVMGYKNHSTINRIESGKIDIPQSRIAQFANVLNTSIAYLMEWDDEKVQQKNDVAVDIVIRLGKDEDFCELVKLLYKLDSEQLQAVKAMLNSFFK